MGVAVLGLNLSSDRLPRRSLRSLLAMTRGKYYHIINITMTILIIQKTAAIGEIILSSPDTLNLIEEDTFSRISQALDEFEREDEIKTVLIRAQCGVSKKTGQKIFSAGVNLKKYKNLLEPEGISQGKAEELFREKLEKNRELLEKIEEFPKPVIIGIDGLVIGGFFELALACDVVLTSHEAVFCLNEVNIGLIPGYGGIHRLLKLVGRTRAFEIISTGRRIKSDEALNLGIVSRILPEKEFISYCNELAAKSKTSLKLIKDSIRRISAGESVNDAEVRNFMQAATSQEAKLLLLKYL